MSLTSSPLHLRFLETVERFPDNVALEIGDQRWTYRQLRERAASLAATLDTHSGAGPRMTGIYGSRSFTAYAGVLAALMRGHAYVPLNPADPAERTRKLIQQTGIKAMIVDQKAEASLSGALRGCARDFTAIVPDRTDEPDLEPASSNTRLLTARDLSKPSAWKCPHVEPDDLAYVLFTSGSTGEPKGVMVRHRNAMLLVNTLIERHTITSADRISQLADLSFDPSVGDLFTAWLTGASLCCPTNRLFLSLPAFIRDGGITVLQAVPSTGLVIQRLGALKPGSFPKLRVSLFGGEAFPVALASQWSIAAPNSILENLYGPTECTVDATAYRWTEERGKAEAENGIVPIGDLLPGFGALVVDEHLNEVAPGDKGELLLSGPQVAAGYIGDPERTARTFINVQSRSELFYRTGDLVRRPLNDKPYTFFGRLDHQVKIFGLRIELGEIEAALRQVTGVMEVAAIGWPIRDTGVGGIVGFVGRESLDSAVVRQQLMKILPAALVPGEIRVLSNLPLNANGKVDRQRLLAMLSIKA